MIEFGGIYYYIDFKAFETLLGVNEILNDEITKSIMTTTTRDSNGLITSIVDVVTKTPKSKEIDITKFELIRDLLDKVLNSEDEGDTALGGERALAENPLSYKIAFNTLYEYGIIKEKE
jgi:uncharacterized membrane protein YjjP (DUF1212 family)